VPTTTDAARLAFTRDGNWINISGRVVSAAADRFVMDYGSGNVTVEMDDWDWYQEGRAILPGDEVVVTGRADTNLFARKTIEARSVYVKKLNTFYYASAADEETPPVVTVSVPPSTGGVESTGTVSAVEGREFNLTFPGGVLRVDTSALSDNPMDGEGAQQIKVGDRVRVWGDLDLEVGENAERKARNIVSMAPDRTKAGPAPERHPPKNS